MEYLVWVGPRDSDIQFDNNFNDSICYFSYKNSVPCREAHIYGKKFVNFIDKKMKNILQYHPEAKFIFYNPKIAYHLDAEMRDHVLCLNSKYILDLLSDKIYTRYWLGNYVPVLPSILVDSSYLSFADLESKLGTSNAYIAQKNKSSGGFGTFYISRENHMLEYLRKTYNELLIVSPYIDNGLSINVNVIVGEKQICNFPLSLQIIERKDNRLIYHGADYISVQKLPAEIQARIQNYLNIILNHIQSLGYRGILGVDFLVKNNNIYFQEINPRYQASSFPIDASLSQHGYSNLTKMNIKLFYAKDKIDINIENLSINYSFYKFFYEKDAKHLYYIEKVAKNNSDVLHICLDGWKQDLKDIEKDAYCYAVVFSTNITSLNFDGGYNLYSNISGEEEYLKDNIFTQIGLKIALLNQGCTISKDAIDFLNSQGVIKKAVFSSIDFQLSDGLYINAPVNLKFTDFSPFKICISSDKHLELNYYDKFVSNINIEMQADWNDLLTKNNVPYSTVAYLSTDRLRLKHEVVCEMKRMGKGCAFCSVSTSRKDFNTDDLKEVISNLLVNPEFRHILIGGGSGDPNIESKKIIDISKFIRAINPEIPIYLMSLPPFEKNVLEKYKRAGINEIAFNIEIWNRSIAKKIMPGKGQISLEIYLSLLKAATEFWGTTGNVRTALIVGLNNSESLFEGIQILCENGIQPMLSVFRPMKNTKLESFVPPTNKVLLSIYEKAQNICGQYNLKLGPICDACKNNMLAI